jgi:uncharacterized protein
MRTLVILIALALIFMVGKRLWLSSRRPAEKAPGKPGQMVQCAHCGMHIPSQEALTRDGHQYCSAAHRDADAGPDA